MSNQEHRSEPQERTDAVEELDELMTDESAEPGMSYTIEYDDDTDTDTADTIDTTDVSVPEPATATTDADHADPDEQEAEAAANTAAAALDEPDEEDSADDVDDSVFRAYPMFSMRGVTVADAKTGEHIWNDLSIRCEAGTSYGVLVDAHDTRQHDTLVALMAGFAHPTEGSVLTKSTPLHDLTPLELRGHRIGVLLQQFALRGDLSAEANLAYVMDASNRNYLQPIAVRAQELLTRVGFAPSGDDDATNLAYVMDASNRNYLQPIAVRAQELLTRDGIAPRCDDDATQDKRSRARVRTLGAVDRARVLVARAIATDPDIVLADGPTATLDEADAADILDLLRAQGHGEWKRRTVSVVTTDPHVAAAMDETIDLTH